MSSSALRASRLQPRPQDHRAGAVGLFLDLDNSPVVAVSFEHVADLWLLVAHDVLVSSGRFKTKRCEAGGHSISLSAPQGAVAWVEERQSGRRSYVGGRIVLVGSGSRPLDGERLPSLRLGRELLCAAAVMPNGVDGVLCRCTARRTVGPRTAPCAPGGR